MNVRLEVSAMAQIFLCHANEDKAHVREVYHRLCAIDGFEPWLDEEDLLPGHDGAMEQSFCAGEDGAKMAFKIPIPRREDNSGRQHTQS
jgi:hypothetical protein